MREHEFKQVASAFLKCALPDQLQELASPALSIRYKPLAQSGRSWHGEIPGVRSLDEFLAVDCDVGQHVVRSERSISFGSAT